MPDGTPAFFYMNYTRSPGWVIHLSGGGWRWSGTKSGMFESRSSLPMRSFLITDQPCTTAIYSTPVRIKSDSGLFVPSLLHQRSIEPTTRRFLSTEFGLRRLRSVPTEIATAAVTGSCRPIPHRTRCFTPGTK